VHLSFLTGNFIGDTHTLYKYIRNSIIGHPLRGYNLDQQALHSYSQASQDKVVLKILSGRRKGFFVECGASNGETFSNTLTLEMRFDWDGLLIEANPNLFKILLGKGRKAYSLNACLSITNETKRMAFYPAGLLGGLQEGFDSSHKKAIGFTQTTPETKYITCYPLQDVMAAFGRDHIDYFSLDVEGPEVPILRTIPFEHLKIDVMTVEYTVWDGRRIDVPASKAKLAEIRELMQSTGLYDEYGLVHIDSEKKLEDLEGTGLDVVFVRKDLNV
jgi:hypothetical protein